jgi:DNA N-6-adenine-methyltransferase (Dam)
MKENHELINQDSGNTEWYTPVEIIEAARKTLGRIDLDPFSCAKANEVVKATHIFTKEDDGFSKPWFGKVWCNHPFSRENNKRIAEQVSNQHYGNDCEIVMITFAATSESWFKPLLHHPQCYLHGRTNYYDQNGNKVKGVTKGSVITYLGKDVKAFYEAFKHLGMIKIAYKGA